MMNQIPEPYGNKLVNGIRHPYLYLWDAWSYVEENILHLYCLAISRYNSNGDEINPNKRNDFPFHIRHFTSIDVGVSWKDEGCFLKPEDIPKLNYRTIWSGSVKPLPSGKKLVAYTGIEDIDSAHCFLQNIAIGVSEDGYTVNKKTNQVLSSPLKDWKTIIEKGYYLDSVDRLGNNKGEENGPILSWRDPFVFVDKDDKVNLFWAAKVGPRIGAMARAILKTNGDSWEIEELYPPIIVPDYEDFTQLEVPKILFNEEHECYYLIISSCNRLYENQPDSEVSKEVRLYTSKKINGPWKSLGEKILGKENLFGTTVLKEDFKNNRLLCMAPYTEKANRDLMLSFAPIFYIYLDELRVEFIDQVKTII